MEMIDPAYRAWPRSPSRILPHHPNLMQQAKGSTVSGDRGCAGHFQLRPYDKPCPGGDLRGYSRQTNGVAGWLRARGAPADAVAHLQGWNGDGQGQQDTRGSSHSQVHSGASLIRQFRHQSYLPQGRTRSGSVIIFRRPVSVKEVPASWRSRASYQESGLRSRHLSAGLR